MTLQTVLALGSFLFASGLIAVFTRKNLIAVIMGIELLLNGAAVNFAGAAYFSGDMHGRIMVLFIISIAALEAAVLLSLVYAFYRESGSLSLNALKKLKH